MTTKEHLSVSEAADYLGVHPTTLRRWEAEGRIAAPSRTPTGQRRYTRGELDSILHPAPTSKGPE